MTDATSVLAAPTAATVATAAAAAALSTWGSWAIVLFVLGAMLWRSHLEKANLKEEKASLKEENTSLRRQLDEIQAKRIEDAQKQRLAIETNTATTAARSEGDQAYRDLLLRLVEQIADLKDQIRQPRRSSR